MAVLIAIVAVWWIVVVQTESVIFPTPAQVVTGTNGGAFTVADPTNPTKGQRITITIRNARGSGLALGAVTWGAIYKLATWTQPADGFSRSVDFIYDGTYWVEKSRTPADVPN